MALFPRIKCTTTTTGTGSITLSATGVRDAVNGDCIAPAEFASTFNRITSYWLQSGNNYAFGTGVISGDGLTLTRDPLEKSWTGAGVTNAPLSLTGTTTFFISPRPADVGAGRRGRSLALARGMNFTG